MCTQTSSALMLSQLSMMSHSCHSLSLSLQNSTPSPLPQPLALFSGEWTQTCLLPFFLGGSAQAPGDSFVPCAKFKTLPCPTVADLFHMVGSPEIKPRRRRVLPGRQQRGGTRREGQPELRMHEMSSGNRYFMKMVRRETRED